MDEPPVVNGRVFSRELYAAISSLREELGSAQRAQTADVMAAVAATEHRLASRIDRLEATSSGHDDLIQQLRGARSLLTLIFGASVLTTPIGVLLLIWHVG